MGMKNGEIRMGGNSIDGGMMIIFFRNQKTVIFNSDVDLCPLF